MRSVAKWLFGVCLLLLSCAAYADANGEAKAHYQKASALFATGHFAEAGEHYEAAYLAKQDPALLYNAAQAYRLAGQHEKALILYKNYVLFFPNEQNVQEVQAQIAKLKEVVAAAEKAKTAPPQDTAEPKPAPAVEPKAPRPQPTTPTAATERESESPKPVERVPVYKKWWLWTIVGVVVAGGVVTAAVLATRPSGTWANVSEFGPGSANGLRVQW